MSCFIHERETFDKLFKFIHEHPKMLAEVQEFELTPGTFVEKLAKYNVDAFRENYSGRHLEEVDTMEDYCILTRARAVKSFPVITPSQALKYLDSLDYQCSDSTAYRREFRAIVYCLQHILQKGGYGAGQEYDEARWS